MNTTGSQAYKPIALQAAATLMAGGRFDLHACANGDTAAAVKVTEVADVFVAWLRKLATVKLTLVAIEEITTGEPVTDPLPGGNGMTNIDTSQRARYSVTAKDDQNIPADYALGARSSNPAVASVEYFNIGDEGNTSNGSDAEIDQVLATFAGTLGTTTVEVFDPANPDVVLAADVVVANPGNVATASLGEAVIEEIPPAPTPE